MLIALILIVIIFFNIGNAIVAKWILSQYFYGTVGVGYLAILFTLHNSVL